MARHSWKGSEKIIHLRGEFLTDSEHSAMVTKTYEEGYQGLGALTIILDADYIGVCKKCGIWRVDTTGCVQQPVRFYTYYKNKKEFIDSNHISHHKAPECKGDK